MSFMSMEWIRGFVSDASDKKPADITVAGFDLCDAAACRLANRSTESTSGGEILPDYFYLVKRF